MAKEKKITEIVSEPTDSLNNLKNVAKQFRSYMNSQYKNAVSYIPDTNTIASVTVSKWLEMPKTYQEALELPGFPMGSISCIYGKNDSGKTTMIMEAIAQCQKQNILPILILTEHKFDFNRLSKYMSADPEAMLVFHADNLEQGYAYVEKILTDIQNNQLVITDEETDKDTVIDLTGQDLFIFWDSIGNTMSETEMSYGADEWDKSMGKGAKAIKNLTKRTNRLLSKVRQRAGIVFINQSYMSMPTYGPATETPYGGEGVPYSSALVIRTKKAGDIKMTVQGKEMAVGVESKLQVTKNHITHKRPIVNVLFVATGMLSKDKEALDEYKKKYLRGE